MSRMGEHFISIQNRRNDLEARLIEMERTPGMTFQDLRVIRRELEQLDHQLQWEQHARTMGIQ